MGDEVVINFGRRPVSPCGTWLRVSRDSSSGHFKGEFPADTKEVVQNALEGKYPMRATAKRAPRRDTLGSIEGD